jgi:DNA-binding LytR/AlgR family response regulator
MVKVLISEIHYIEAERNYCRIYTTNKEYLLVLSLREIEEKLPDRHFIRIHRSYIINLSQIMEVATTSLIVGQKLLSLSKSYRDELLKRLQTI